MFLQYYVIESATGKQVDIEIDAATKADLDATQNAGRPSGIPISSLTPRRKSMLLKLEMVKFLH